MTTSLLVLATIFLVTTLFLSLVLWPFFPDWFGVFGYKRRTPVGKFIIKLLMLFPVIATGSLYISWSSETSSTARFIVLIPALYIIILWLYSPDKNKRCFITKENNLNYFLKDMKEQLNHYDRLIKNEGNLTFSYFCLSPDSSTTEKITTAIGPSCQYVREYVSGGYMVNKVTFIEGFTPALSSIGESELKEQLSQAISKVWDAGGEFGGWRLVTQKSVSDRVELDQA